MSTAKKEKSTHGGDRGGRKPHKYGEPTVPMRVPVSLVPALEKKMKAMESKAAKK